MLLTVFTPAYNRSGKIKQIYDSFKYVRNFEWLIVDDGSEDDTENIVNDLIKESVIDIRYIKKENGGKHTAHNLAVDFAKGKYFMCLDSDDYVSKKGFELLINTLGTLDENEGIVAYKCDYENILLSEEFPDLESVESIYELNCRYSCHGEFVFVFPTDLLKKNKFPVFKGESFITESVLYDKLKCKMKLLPQIIQVCEYQTDGLSNRLNEIMKKNPIGYTLYFMQRIDMQDSLVKKIIYAAKYWSFYLFSNHKKINYDGINSFLVLCSFPLGVIFCLYYKLRRGF